ncbi:MAG: NUDIX domain-containing protein [Synergistaceae bacterium]|nr:NUDIX domain-containing protein [Synergistaceae bacterium]
MTGSLSYPMPIVFCFVLGEEQVLLHRRLKAPWNGSVTVPGGRKEWGETAREACIREVEEETGYRLLSLKLRGIAHIVSGGQEATGYYFSSDSYEGELKSSDEGESFWYSREGSMTLEGINPFYRLLAPRIFDGEAPLFEVKVESDEERILSFSFEDA